MIKTVSFTAFVFLFFCLQLFLQDRLSNIHGNLPWPQSAVILPEKLVDVAALDYKALVSDLIFLDVLNRFGKTLERTNGKVVGGQVEDWEWSILFDEIELASAMDPYFFDPYYFANAILTYNADLIPRVNHLLKKGTEERTWDWELPFFVGYNYFFEFNQPKEASTWLMRAAAKQANKGSLLATLAARLAYEGSETENAIIFLKAMLASASDQIVKSAYETRLKSLEGVYLLEKALAEYIKRYGVRAKSLDELVHVGILQRFPVDPYGGVYFLTEDNKVRSTSGLRPVN